MFLFFFYFAAVNTFLELSKEKTKREKSVANIFVEKLEELVETTVLFLCVLRDNKLEIFL